MTVTTQIADGVDRVADGIVNWYLVHDGDEGGNCETRRAQLCGARDASGQKKEPNLAEPASIMSDLDERVDLGRVRDLRGRWKHPWMRRGLVVLLAVPVLLALTGALGQSTKTLKTVAPAVTLQVEVPDVLRGGLMWRARIVVRAARSIEFPRIVLGSGFVHGMQLNTLEPAPESEASRGQRVVLSYDELAAGDELVVYLQLQVDPTTVGVQDTSVELDDEEQPLARLTHTTRVLP